MNNNNHSEQMNKKDRLGEYIKSMPVEKVPSNFSIRVMELVSQENKLSSEIYRPLISKKIWSMLFTLVGLTFLFIFVTGSAFSGNDAATSQSLIPIFDARPFATFLSSLSGFFKQIPFTVLLGLLSVSLLLLIDQLYFRIKTPAA